VYIKRDDQERTWTFVPSDQDEEQIVQAIAALEPKSELTKMWVEKDENGRRRKINFGFGGKKILKKTEWGSEPDYEGGTQFVLQGTTLADQEEAGLIRDVCYFGSGGLTFLSKTEVDGRCAVVVTAMFCKQCNEPMATFSGCSKSICNACAKKCEHVFEEGYQHGGEAQLLSRGSSCIKCGRPKPDEKPEVLITYEKPAWIVL